MVANFLSSISVGDMELHIFQVKRLLNLQMYFLP